VSGILAPGLQDADHVVGADGAALGLVMYGDFQCPYCAAAQPIVARVRERLGDELRFAFRHFPLVEIHLEAQLAAEAAEAAAAQGSFWAMHDRLYAGHGRLARAHLLGAARELGLDQARMAGELDAGAWVARVARDVDSGQASGVSGTPAFFVNGRRHDDAFDAGSLVDALRSGSARR